MNQDGYGTEEYGLLGSNGHRPEEVTAVRFPAPAEQRSRMRVRRLVSEILGRRVRAPGLLMALEHSDEKKRGFSASLREHGRPAGAVLSTVVLAIVTLLSVWPPNFWPGEGSRPPRISAHLVGVQGRVIGHQAETGSHLPPKDSWAVRAAAAGIGAR